jgi:diphthamide synthase (EF-2-diphthine--ammonia ligase)
MLWFIFSGGKDTIISLHFAQKSALLILYFACSELIFYQLVNYASTEKRPPSICPPLQAFSVSIKSVLLRRQNGQRNRNGQV